MTRPHGVGSQASPIRSASPSAWCGLGTVGQLSHGSPAPSLSLSSIGDGLCDIGTGVLFLPSLDPPDQVSTCTPSFDVAVAAGSRLKLPALARTGSGRRDKDRITLVCE